MRTRNSCRTNIVDFQTIGATESGSERTHTKLAYRIKLTMPARRPSKWEGTSPALSAAFSDVVPN